MGLETLIPIGASLLGSAMQSDSVEDASDTQAASTREGIAEQRRQADRAWEAQTPYRAAAGRALGTLEGEINRMPTAAEVMAQPGYQFGMQQGQQGLDRKAAAAGGRVSGAALKAASTFATNYAASGYGAEYTRRQDRLSRLQTLAVLGQSATSNAVGSSQNSANAISGLLQNQGDASGAAQMARGNIWGNAINEVGAAGQRWARRPPDPDPYGVGGW